MDHIDLQNNMEQENVLIALTYQAMLSQAMFLSLWPTLRLLSGKIYQETNSP